MNGIFELQKTFNFNNSQFSFEKIFNHQQFFWYVWNWIFIFISRFPPQFQLVWFPVCLRRHECVGQRNNFNLFERRFLLTVVTYFYLWNSKKWAFSSTRLNNGNYQLKIIIFTFSFVIIQLNTKNYSKITQIFYSRIEIFAKSTLTTQNRSRIHKLFMAIIMMMIILINLKLSNFNHHAEISKISIKFSTFFYCSLLKARFHNLERVRRKNDCADRYWPLPSALSYTFLRFLRVE